LKDQPDFKCNGTFFSINLILLVNILWLSGLLALITPGMDAAEFLCVWKSALRSICHALADGIIQTYSWLFEI
jgi:hypothetical protein